MNYRYRVEGRIEKAFILRGMYFCIGGKINTLILERELPFVEAHCELNKVEELNAPSQPISIDSEKKKEVKNELSKPSSTTNKSKPSTKILLDKP